MCGFGLHLESRPHRFDRIYFRNKKKWDFWMHRCCVDDSGERYGWGRVLDYIGIDWRDPEHWWMTKGQINGQGSIFDFMEVTA